MESNQSKSLPYDVVICRRGIVAYGPAGTEPFSRDWTKFDGGIDVFLSVVCRPDFDLNVRSWRVKTEW